MSSTSVRVVVRCVPTAEEKAWKVGERSLSLASAAGTSTSLEFDRVCNDSVGHETFFEQAVTQELSGVLEGHNAFIVAYGLPCTGKTHTIFGTTGQTRVKQEARGVIVRCGQQLFDILQRPENAGLACRVTVTFCHLFENGRVADLFDAKKRSLNVVEKGTTTGGMPSYEVEGLTEQIVTSPQDVLRLVEKGYLMRNASGCVSDTGAGGGTHGKVSLRGNNAPLQQYRQHNSHAIFKFTAETVNVASPGEATVASIVVVDLAGLGIERLLSGASCTDVGIEAMHQVLRSLAANRIGEVPALSAKSCLTKLLRACFGGNSRALVVGSVSLGESAVPLTLKCLEALKEMQSVKNHRQRVTLKGNMSALSGAVGEIQRLKTQLLQRLGVHASAADAADKCEVGQDGGRVVVQGAAWEEELSVSCQDIAKQIATLESGIIKGGVVFKSNDKPRKGSNTQGIQPMVRPSWQPPQAQNFPTAVKAKQGPSRNSDTDHKPAAEPTRTLPHPESFGPHMFDAPIKSPVHQLLKGLDSHRGTGFGSGHALAQQDDTTTSDDSDNDSMNSAIHKPKATSPTGVPPPPLVGIPHIAPDAGVRPPRPASGAAKKPADRPNKDTFPLPRESTVILKQTQKSLPAVPKDYHNNSEQSQSQSAVQNDSHSNEQLPQRMVPSVPYSSDHSTLPTTNGVGQQTPTGSKRVKIREKHGVHNSSSTMPPNSGTTMPPNSGSTMPPNSGSTMPPNSGSIMPTNSVIAEQGKMVLSSLAVLSANSNHHHLPRQGTQTVEAKVKGTSDSTHKMSANQPAPPTPNEQSLSRDPAAPLGTDTITQESPDQVKESTGQMKSLANSHVMHDPHKSSPRKLRQLVNQDRLKSSSNKSMSHKTDPVKSSMNDLSKLEESKTASKQTELEAKEPTNMPAADLSGLHSEARPLSVDRNEQLQSSTNDQAKPSVQLGIPINDQIKPLDQVKQSSSKQTKSGQVKPSIGEQVKLSDQPKTPTSSWTNLPDQVNPPPDQVNQSPDHVNPPPGQVKPPPDQVNLPPGQVKPPPDQVKPPPGQVNPPPGQVNPPTVKKNKHLRERTKIEQVKPTDQQVKPTGQSRTPKTDRAKHLDQVKPLSTRETTEASKTEEQRNQSVNRGEMSMLNTDQEKRFNIGGTEPTGAITGPTGAVTGPTGAITGFQIQPTISSDSPTTGNTDSSTKFLVTNQSIAQKDKISGTVKKDDDTSTKELLKLHQIEENGKIELNSDLATREQAIYTAEGVKPAAQKVQGHVPLSYISANQHLQLNNQGKPSNNNLTKSLANDQIKSPIADQVKSPINDQVKSPINDQVKLPMADQFKSPISDNVKSQSNDQTKLSINDGSKLSASKEFLARDTTNQYNTGYKLELTLPAPQPESSIGTIPQYKPMASTQSESARHTLQPIQPDPTPPPKPTDPTLQLKQLDPTPQPKQLDPTPQPKQLDPTPQPKQLDPTPQPKQLDPTPRSDQTGLGKGPVITLPEQTGNSSLPEIKALRQHTLNLGPEVQTTSDTSSGDTSILASEMGTPLTSTPKHNRRPLDGGGTPIRSSLDERGLPAPPSLPSVHPKKTLLPTINPPPGSAPHHLQASHLSKVLPPQPSTLPQPSSSPAHLQIMPPAVSMPISTVQHRVSQEPAHARAVLSRPAKSRAAQSDSDEGVSSTTDSESEQIRPKAKSAGGQSTRHQTAARLPLYGAPLQNDPGPSSPSLPLSPSLLPLSPSLLPLPPNVMLVEQQRSGSSSPLHAPPPQNELPTYEQLEASFNSVHSGLGRSMFQAAAQQQYTAPEAPPPIGEGMADYLSTQEIHVKAMEGTKASIMMSLVTQCGVDYMDHGGRTPLMYAVLGNQPKMCELLLSMGALVNLTDYSGASSILWATYQSKLEVMKILLRYGADISAQDPDGLTLFHWAVKSPSVQCLKLLCKYATPGIASVQTNEGLTPLHCAVMCNQLEHIKVLLSSTDASAKSNDGEGRTPLTYAVQIGSPQCIKAILSHNDDVINISDEKGRTPLHYACAEGSVDCVKILLSNKKCNLHCQDNRGTVALHWAAAANHPNLVQLLLRRGADRAQKDLDGLTALDHALQRGCQKCVEVLWTTPLLNRSNSASSLAGPFLATATSPVLDESGHVQMNMLRRTSLFGTQESHMSRQESHMSRLPADGQAQVDGEQSSAHKPQGSQNTGPDPSCSDQSAELNKQEASVEQASGHRDRLGSGGWFSQLCSCWTGRHNTVVPLDEPPATPNSNLPAVAT